MSYVSKSPLLRWFALDHLPAELRTVVAPFVGAAESFASTVPPGREATVCMRKILEAKDAAIRAYLESLSETAVTLEQAHAQST